MSEKSALIKTLKNTLKQHGITDEQVAQQLDLSLASIKRLFSQEDLSLERLESICRMMELDISDLVLRMQQTQQQTESLSLEQERELVADTRLLLTTHLLLNGWKAADIVEHYDISDTEMTRYLARLDRMKVLDLHPHNRVKLKISRTFQWQKNGPIQRFFQEHVQDEFFNCSFIDPGEVRIFVSGMITRASNAELMRRIKRLAQNFDELHQEDRNAHLNERFGTSLMLAMRPWDIPQFSALRKPNRGKVF